MLSTSAYNVGHAHVGTDRDSDNRKDLATPWHRNTTSLLYVAPTSMQEDLSTETQYWMERANKDISHDPDATHRQPNPLTAFASIRQCKNPRCVAESKFAKLPNAGAVG